MNPSLFVVAIAGVILGMSIGTRAEVGIVSNVKVLTDNIADVSSVEAWAKSYLKPDMTEEQKAVAVWKSVVSHQHQNPPPAEFLHSPDNVVLDPIKLFNVYGYGLCSVHASHVAALARAAGLSARNQTIVRHCVAEVEWNGKWHMLDASLVNYFVKEDGKIASVDEVIAATGEFYKQHPELKGNPEALEKFRTEQGWKKGPALLANSKFFNNEGLLPANWPWQAGWPETMREYDGSTQFIFEPGYSMGYRVNVQLREGERLTRNWSNKGLHINMDRKKEAPPCIDGKVGEGSMAYLPGYGDLANGRIGNGVHEYEVPLTREAFHRGALLVENVESTPAGVRVKNAGQAGMLVYRMSSSYVYLGGEVRLDTSVGPGGKIEVYLSQNNGLDFGLIETVTGGGVAMIDLKPLVFRRYHYQLKFVLSGAGTGLNRIHVHHDIQHSQRPLPAFVQGSNTIRFSSGNEGTITVEGSTQKENKDKQVLHTAFHPTAENIIEPMISVEGAKGSITFPISTPADMKRLRIFSFYRARGEGDQWTVSTSFDDGKTFKNIGTLDGPHKAMGKQLAVTDIPTGTRSAQVKFTGTQKIAALLFNVRLDADYDEPNGGNAPVKVTYVWDENGAEKRDVHVTANAEESWTIHCATKPVMKSIIVERAN